MYDNIGGKIKALAKTLCGIGIVIFVIFGFIIMIQDDGAILIGLLTMALGSLISWVGSFITYGFGQLIENSDALVKISKRNNESIESPVFVNPKKEENTHKWRCSNCGNMISENICPYCSNEIVIKENLQ